MVKEGIEMKSLDVNVYKVQMAYFFSDKNEIRSFKLISCLYSQLQDVFRTEPQSIPIPEDAPGEVPRCVWNDVNTSLTFNKLRLDFSFNVPTKYNWENLFAQFNAKITTSLEECEVVIDRVGMISEVMSVVDIHDLLKQYVNIEKFNEATEANIAWLEKFDSYNVWTNIFINETNSENKIVFDVNSLPECKLSEQGISACDSMNKCAENLKGKMQNVL